MTEADTLPDADGRLHLGTSSFSSKDWLGVFYPEGTKSGDFLTVYATHFTTVEIDATYYGTPVATTVEGWYRKTPRGFRIAAKFPGEITHEKKLADCEEEALQFVRTMAILEEKLGPLLLQFPRWPRREFPDAEPFLERLDHLLGVLPDDVRYAVEVRNQAWIEEPLLDVLRRHGVALALIDHPAVPNVDSLLERLDLITADFTYVRWIGDRKGIETITKTWDTVVLDRAPEWQMWVDILSRLLAARPVEVYGYVNNHYNGHAPAALAELGREWRAYHES